MLIGGGNQIAVERLTLGFPLFRLICYLASQKLNSRGEKALKQSIKKRLLIVPRNSDDSSDNDEDNDETSISFDGNYNYLEAIFLTVFLKFFD